MEELEYFKFADRWHWTPEQVDNLPIRFALWAPILMDAVDEVRAERGVVPGGDGP